MGFKTFRLPVTWRFHMGGAPDYSIETEWLDRVEEISNYAFENDMYVIINIHHDDPWIIPTYHLMDTVKYKLDKLWTQIAERFKDYGDYLVFETLNEPRYEGSAEEWTGGTTEGRDVVNQYHKACVDAIRATGGNNATRKILIATYAASSNQNAMDDLVIPNADTNTIVSIHTYFPYTFSLEGTDRTWGTNRDKTWLNNEFDRIYNTFVANNIPVVLGEWCNIDNNNYPDRILHADYYTKACVERGITPIWWDANSTSRLLNRSSLQWVTPELIKVLIQGTNPQDCTPTELTPYYQIDTLGEKQTAYISAVSECSEFELILKHDNTEIVKWINQSGDTIPGNELVFNPIRLDDDGFYQGLLINDQGCISWEYFRVVVKPKPCSTSIYDHDKINTISGIKIYGFNEKVLTYTIDKATSVRLNMVSLYGTSVNSQYFDYQPPGTYSYVINKKLQQGIYLLSIETETQSETYKVLMNN
jgi:endoglucanase